MTDEQIQDFLEWAGDELPDPEHSPRTFAYYVKLYKYILQKEKDEVGN